MKKIIFFIVLFAVNTVFGQSNNKAKVDLTTPQATIRTHLHFLDSETYHPEKAAKTIQGYEGERAQELAIKIRKILKGRGLFIVLRKIPNNPDFVDTVQHEPIHRYVLFPERMPEIYVEKVGDKWYYSKQTLLLVDKLYDEVFPWYAQKIQQLLPKFGDVHFLGIAIWKYVGLFLLLIASILLFFILNKIIYLILAKAQPISLLIVIRLITSIIPVINLGIKFNTILFFVVDLLSILFTIYIFLKVVDFLMVLYSNYTAKTESKLDEQLTPILSNLLKIVIVFIGMIKILSFLDVDPIKIIAGLSIGGLAVALASQDTVRNFIGTIMIFVDKPFHIGDFIIAGDVEGTVEKVGFRSTLVRAPDTSLYQITNSRLSEITVKNRGLLKYRRYRTELGIRYDTPPELIDAFVKGGILL